MSLPVLACTIQRLRLPTVEPRTAAARLRHALLDSYEEVKQACWISRSFSKKYVIHVMRITPATDSPLKNLQCESCTPTRHPDRPEYPVSSRLRARFSAGKSAKSERINIYPELVDSDEVEEISK